MNFTDKNIVREECGFPLCGGTFKDRYTGIAYLDNIINFNGVEREK